MGGRLPPESVVGISRNMHIESRADLTPCPHILSEAVEVSRSGLVSIQLDKLRNSVKKTNKYINWYGKRRIEEKENKIELKKVPYSDYEITDYILGSIISKAADWTNLRIEKYIEIFASPRM